MLDLSIFICWEQWGFVSNKHAIRSICCLMCNSEKILSPIGIAGVKHALLVFRGASCHLFCKPLIKWNINRYVFNWNFNSNYQRQNGDFKNNFSGILRRQTECWISYSLVCVVRLGAETTCQNFMHISKHWCKPFPLILRTWQIFAVRSLP